MPARDDLTSFRNLVPGTRFRYMGVLYEKTFVSKAENLTTGEEDFFLDDRQVQVVPDNTEPESN